MTSRYFRGARTKAKNLLQAEIVECQSILQGNGNHSDETRCMKALTLFSTKLEEAHTKFSEKFEPSDDADNLQFEKEEQEVIDLLGDTMQWQLKLESQRDSAINSQPAAQETPLEIKIGKLVDQMAAQNAIPVQPAAAKPSSISLPKLELPTFNGSAIMYREFWDTFSTTIETNASLSNVVKHQYLRSKLVGEAKKLLEGIPIDEHNYDVSVKLLKERYGDKQVEIDAHYVSLMELQQVSNSAPRLRALLDTLMKHLRSLEAPGQSVSQEIFVSLILSKLPHEATEHLELNKPRGSTWNTMSLLGVLGTYVHAKEQAEPAKETKTSSHITVSEAFAINENRDEYTQPTPKCHFCGKDHWSDECRIFPSLESRKEKVLGNCFNCLRRGHQLPQCRFKKSCYHCKKVGNHHRSLCPQAFKGHSASTLVATDETVLMQTATAKVNGIQQSKNARIFLDSGSHRTYITEKLATDLNLTGGKRENISLVTFGNSSPKSIASRVVKFSINGKDGSAIEVSANVVPYITGSIQRAGFDTSKCANWHKFERLPLAAKVSKFTESCTIDVLIGNDYYLDIIQPEKKVVQPGLYLLNSKLGWILAGRIHTYEPIHSLPNLLILTHGSLPLSNVQSYVPAEPQLAAKKSLEDFWSLETNGILDNPMQADDEVAQQLFDNSVTKSDGRYEVRFPWKEYPPKDLPNNWCLAKGRLNTLCRRLNASHR